MKKEPISVAALLRQKADQQLKAQTQDDAAPLSDIENLRLVHELEVHQIELEMQNEELLLAKYLAEDATQKVVNIYDFAPSGYLSLSREGNIIELNFSAAALLGKERGNLKNKRFGLFVSHESGAAYNLFLETIFESKDKPLCEISLVSNGNEPTYVYLKGIYSEADDKCLVTMFDITERKLAEAALCISEQDLKEAQRLARIGSWDWNALTDKIRWSEEYYHIYDLDPSQQPPGYEEHLKLYTPESAARLNEAVKKNMETGEPYELELELANSDNPYRWVTARSETKRDETGKIIGLRGTAQDITERKRAEKVLKESEYFFKESQRAAFIGSYKTDFIKGYWESSEILDQIFGIDLNYVRSVAGWLDIVHPDDRERMNTYLLEEVIAKRQPFNMEYRIIRKDDRETKWVNGFGTVDFDTEGNIISMIGTIQDTTERKQAEEKLQASELKFRTIADYTFDWEYWLGVDNRLIYISPSSLRTSGYTSEEITVNPELLSSMVHPDDFHIYNHHFEEVYAPSSKQDYCEAEFRIITKEGAIRNIHHICRPVFDHDNNFLGRRVSNRDITERKQAEQQLQQASESWSKTFDAIQDGIILLDQNQNILASNQAFLDFVGKTKQQIIGLRCYETVHGTQCPHINCPYVKLAVSKKRETTEMELKGIACQVMVDPIIDSENNLIGAVHIITDISQRKKAEKSVQDKIAELQRFFDVTIGRELKMIELKQEINELARQLGEEEDRYIIVD